MENESKNQSDADTTISETIRTIDMEKRIMNIIEKVIKNRNRPCHQSIHTYLVREAQFKDIEKQDLKGYINSMIDSGKLENVGTTEKESYRIRKTEKEEEAIEHNNEFEFDFYPKLGQFLEKFMAKVITMVDEKINEINEKLSTLIDPKPINCTTPLNKSLRKLPKLPVNEDGFTREPTNQEDSVGMIKNYEAKQLCGLREEVKFLRNELKSRNDIIGSLRNEKNIHKITSAYKSTLVDKEITPNRQNSSTNMNVVQIDVGVKRKQRNRKIVEKNGSLQIITNRDDCNAAESRPLNDGFEEFTKKKPTDPSKRTSRVITIIGDSTIKDIQSHKMKRRLKPNEKLYVKSFSGAIIEDMVDYVRPTMRRSPDLVVLHAGTNNLRESDKSAKDISSDIMKLVLEMKFDNNDVMVSSITARADDVHLYHKSLDVNKRLKEDCDRYGLYFIDNSNIEGRKTS